MLDVPGLRRPAARRCTAASCRSSRSRRRPPRRSPRRCCSTTSRRTCTRATRRTPSGAPPRSRSTATCCASCSARRSCASSSTPTRSTQVEADLQHRSERTRADDARRAARRPAPGRRPDAPTRCASACSRASTPTRCSTTLERRAPRDPPARRRRGALDRRRRRRPVPRRARRRAARRPAGGVPRRRRPTRSSGSSPATRAPTGRSRPRELRAPLRRRPDEPRSRRSSAPATLVRGELRPGGSEREWCDAEVLRRLRRASLAVLRKEIEPADQRALARLPAELAGRRPPSGRRRRDRPPARGARPAAGARAARRRLGARRAAAPRRRLLADVAGPAVRERRGRLGRRRRARAQLRPRRAVLPRGRRGARARRRARRAEPPDGADARAAARAPARRRRASSPTCWPRSPLAPEELQEALWDLVWAGEVTNDAWAPLRAPRLTLARAQPRALRAAARAGRRFGARRGGAQRAGPGPLVADGADLPPASPSPASAAARSGRAAARALRHRHPRAGARRGHPRRLLDRSTTRCRSSRRSASAAAATSSRGSAARSSRCRARSSGCARSGASEEAPPLVLAATDPAQPYGAALPWPQARSPSRASPRAPPAPTSCSPAPSPSLYVERGGRGLQFLVDADDPRVRPALSRRSPTSSPRDRARAARRSSASTASRSSGPRGRRCWSSWASAGPRKLTLSA